MKNNFSILSTKILKPYILQQLVDNDFNIIEHDFIKIEEIKNTQFNSILNDHQPNYIFTSKNAVRSFIKQVTDNKIKISKKAVFCTLSGETQKALLDEGFSATIIADNAADLAHKIITGKSFKEALFFCGDKRRDQLSIILKEAGIVLTELVLYKNIEQPKKIDNIFQAILFFSPSAIQSFFKENVLPKTTACFCVGYTTANALKEYKITNKVIVSSYPSQQVMIDVVLNYFNKKN